MLNEKFKFKDPIQLTEEETKQLLSVSTYLKEGMYLTRGKGGLHIFRIRPTNN